MKAHIFFMNCIVFAVCGALSGCKSSPTPEKDTPSDSAPATDSVATPAAVSPATPPPVELSASEREAITLALGCAPESVTEKGCRECPSYEGAWGEDVEPLAEIAITLTPGVWSDAAHPQVLARFEGCNPADFGALYSTEIVHLVKDPAEGWSPASYFTAGGVTDVRPLDSPEKPGRTLVQMGSGRMGVYATDYIALSWQELEQVEGLDMAGQTSLLTTTDGSGCEENWEVFHAVNPTIEDVNDDGWVDVAFEVKTSMGPYTGSLEECPDGDTFSAPLSPERTPTTLESSYLYHGGPQGWTEHEGQGPMVPVSAEYESFL